MTYFMDPMEAAGGYTFNDSFHEIPHLDFSNIEDLMAQPNQTQDPSYSKFPGLVDPPDFQFRTAFEPLLHDPMLKGIHDLTEYQSQSVYSEPSTRMPSPGFMSTMQHQPHQQQIWPEMSAPEQKMNLPQLDTQFNGYQHYSGPIQRCQPLMSEPSSLSVDPSFIQHLPSSHSMSHTPGSAGHLPISQVPSLSPTRTDDSQHISGGPLSASSENTPAQRLSPLVSSKPSRNPSIHSATSNDSHKNVADYSTMLDEDGNQRTQCPYPDCGKTFKDLKAHMLTHQNERPEKCPITSCDFHRRGFARKYDRNRHLITTHYKATVVCGFCPGEGSSSEKSFNRIDLFKRHLMTAHNADQNSGSSKKRTSRGSIKSPPSLHKSSDTSGRCTTCGNTFASAQELFDHLDDCILQHVTKPDDAESANERNLSGVMDDSDVLATMQRHSLPSYPSSTAASNIPDFDDGSDDGEDTFVSRPSKARRSNGSGSIPIINDVHMALIQEQGGRSGGPGLTYSKGGVDLKVARRRKQKKDYPQSWGCATDDMTLKKRVLCCFDGQRRLLKDDMMLPNEFSQRIQLPEGGYVSNLDVETLKRAEAYHNATEEEKGPWFATNYHDPTIMQHQPVVA